MIGGFDEKKLVSLAQALSSSAQRAFERRLWVWTGSAPTISRAVLALQKAYEASARQIFVCDRVTGNLQANLGREIDLCIFCPADLIHQGEIDASALAILAGALKAGGLLVLTLPQKEKWPDLLGRRPFERRLIRILQGDSGGLFTDLETGLADSDFIFTNGEIDRGDGIFDAQRRSQAGALAEQDQIAEALAGTLCGSHKKTSVVLGVRGRGKSSALGRALARALFFKEGRALVTAPSKASVQSLFAGTERELWALKAAQARASDAFDAQEGDPPGDRAIEVWVKAQMTRLRFLSFGSLLEGSDDADWLLVDEAAAFPIDHLQALNRRFPRCLFSSTVQGYEGTGRGFLLKFKQMLARARKPFTWMTLKKPWRYREGDPLESLLNRILVLHAEEPEKSAGDGALNLKADPNALAIGRIAQETLAEDEADLAKFLGLLNAAHYRTSVFDAAFLLDGEALTLYAGKLGSALPGVLLLQTEDPLPEPLGRQICEGRRRPFGHLLQAVLAAHSGAIGAVSLKLGRVLRIAVDPRAQNQGLGRALLGKMEREAKEAGLDAVGASFGATPALLSFWCGAGYSLLRIGVEKGESSGLQSAVVLKALSQKGESLIASEAQVFKRRLAAQLLGPLQEVDPALALAILRFSDPMPFCPDDRDWRDLKAICFFGRGPMQAQKLLFDFACALFADRTLNSPGGAEAIFCQARDPLCKKLSQQSLGFLQRGFLKRAPKALCDGLAEEDPHR